MYIFLFLGLKNNKYCYDVNTGHRCNVAIFDINKDSALSLGISW